MSKIIGVTVHTPLNPQTIRKKLNPVLSVNGIAPDENGNVEVAEGSGGQYSAGENISISDDGKISVLTADTAEAGNTKPITSAAVATQIGNIEILLNTI